MGNRGKDSSRNYERYEFEFNALPFERILERYRRRRLLEIIEKNIARTSLDILEIGPGYNSLLQEINLSGEKIVIEPATQLYSHNLLKFSGQQNVRVYNEEISEFASKNPDKRFDLVILSSVLHEFSDAASEMSYIFALMNRGGKLIVVVPNNESIHRQFGVTMGVLASVTSLTPTETLMQQNTNYSIKTLTKFVNKCGFVSEFVTTSFVKPHTHSQMQEWFDSGILGEVELENLYKLSDLFHPYNSEIFLIANKP